MLVVCVVACSLGASCGPRYPVLKADTRVHFTAKRPTVVGVKTANLTSVGAPLIGTNAGTYPIRTGPSYTVGYRFHPIGVTPFVADLPAGLRADFISYRADSDEALGMEEEFEEAIQ